MRVRARARQRGIELPLVISDHADWDGLCATIDATGAGEIWVTHGQEDALVHWCKSKGLAARPLDLVGYGDEDEGEIAADGRGGRRMNRFAELLDRLAYEPGRNNKLRLITAYFRETADPDRGYALAALTGALSFKHAKPGLIRDLITDAPIRCCSRCRMIMSAILSETVALMWPKAELPGHNNPPPPTLTEVVTTLRTLGKTELPKQLARWLDELDETGRWALLKLVTGAMRIGVSARLAKTAAANLGDKDAHEVELIWPGLTAALSRPVRVARRPRR